MKHDRLARRTFGLMAASVFSAWGQSKLARLTEENEWAEAYELSRRVSSDRPKEGVVSNAEIAKRIGEAVAAGVYGEDTAVRERPFRARLRGSVWTVMGTLSPRLALGGVAIIQISKADGRVLFVHHTQ